MLRRRESKGAWERGRASRRSGRGFAGAQGSVADAEGEEEEEEEGGEVEGGKGEKGKDRQTALRREGLGLSTGLDESETVAPRLAPASAASDVAARPGVYPGPGVYPASLSWGRLWPLMAAQPARRPSPSPDTSRRSILQLVMPTCSPPTPSMAPRSERATRNLPPARARTHQSRRQFRITSISLRPSIPAPPHPPSVPTTSSATDANHPTPVPASAPPFLPTFLVPSPPHTCATRLPPARPLAPIARRNLISRF